MPVANSNRDDPALDPSLAVDVYLRTSPKDATYRGSLEDLARVGWSGEHPVYFYMTFGEFLGQLPWLVDRWGIDGALLTAIERASTSGFEEWVAWNATAVIGRKRTRFAQIEGLLLLARLEAPEERAAYEQLVLILDQVNDLLVTDLRGTAKRIGRRHPLTDVFLRIGRPQSIAALASAVKKVVDESWVLYPMASDFLRSTVLPMICGQPWTWTSSPSLPRLLGVDQDPVVEISTPAPSLDFDLPEAQARPFTPNDLVGELGVVLQSDDFTETIRSLSPLWRGERSWDFLEGIHRLSHTLPWLKPALMEVVDLKALQAAGQALNSKEMIFAFNRAIQWRARHGIDQTLAPPSPAVLAPSNRDRRWGILNLRGLLLLGRIRRDQDKGTNADERLGQLIQRLARNIKHPVPGNELSGVGEANLLECILDRLARPDTPHEFASALESLAPEIRRVDECAADLLDKEYLPLVKDVVGKEPTAKSNPVEGSHVSSTQRTPRPGSRRTSAVRRVRISLPTCEKPLEGEPSEEASPSQSIYRRKDSTPKPLPIKEEIRWLQKRHWGSNVLMVRNHIESLSDPEAAIVVELVAARIQSGLDAGQVDDVRLGILTALVLATGQDPRAIASADSRVGEDPEQPQTLLYLQEGRLELQVLRPENAFDPKACPGKHLLESTSPSISLQLPPKVCGWINQLLEIDLGVWQWTPLDLQFAMTAYVKSLEAEIGSGVSLPRLRNFAHANFREVTGDTAKTMILSGSSLGRPTTSLYYYNTSRHDLEASFRAAVWPLFGDDPKSSTVANPTAERVGSRLLVKPETVRELARSPSASLNAPNKIPHESKEFPEHHALTNHILCMLMAVAGHRPTEALLHLRRFDFDTSLWGAIFRDKQCDPAHFNRFVPVADLIANQIEHYIRHLREISRIAGPKAPVSKRALAALHGHAPLFFHINDAGIPVELNLSDWRLALPEKWQQFPLNWGRTWLVSRGREAGMEPDHLAIMLGHLESTGYPYSSDSPLEPAQLSGMLGDPLGNLARSAGWVVRKGRGGNDDPMASILEAGPLRSWRNERQALASEARAFQVEQRHVLRSQMRTKRERGELLVLEELRTLLEQDVPTFHEISRRTRSAGSKEQDPGDVEQSIEISPEDLEGLERRLEAAAADDKVLMIAAQNALYRYLKHVQKHLGWRCPVPSAWLSPASMEPTPFFSGLFRATLQVRALRESFGKIPPKPQTGSGFSDFEWAVGIACLALCIFSFESDKSHVLSILAGRMSGTTSSTLQDLFLVETDDRPKVSGIRGLSAIALARLKRDHPNKALPDRDRLDAVLAALVPSALVDRPAGLLERLCATISVTNLVELSGLARLANDPKSGCVAMPISRQRQFLEEGVGAATTKEASPVDDSAALPRGGKCSPSAALKQYQSLSRTLFIGDGPKKFALTDKTLSQANIGAFRGPLLRELEAFLGKDNLSPLVALIASRALHLTQSGTVETSTPAWNTVYRYITCFGRDLVELTGNQEFFAMDADEHLHLYQDVIDRKTSDTVKVLAVRELAGFHAYLEEHHAFDSVDFSEIEGAFSVPGQQVDADLVQPQELLHALRHMEDLTSPPDSLGDAPTLRLNRQSHVFALLLGATGARHNELAALRFKDLLASSDHVVVFARSSRYRRLKTSAARRVIDCTKKLSRHQRTIVSNWITAERARLATSWKGTLPIFADLHFPKNRVPSSQLRDATLEALSEPIGMRSKVHRVRHLFASEAQPSIWLSTRDWDELRRSRASSRRLAKGRRRLGAVVMPRKMRQESISLGHRRNSTTVLSYFHMPWMTLSRPHASLNRFENRHSASVALGLTVAAADKIAQRKKAASRTDSPASSWLLAAAGSVTDTPGKCAVIRASNRVVVTPMPFSARHMDRILRDVQKGLPLDRAATSHGMTEAKRDYLVDLALAIERRVGFTLIPKPGRKQTPRSARQFESTSEVVKLLNLMDDGSEDDRDEVQRLSSTYLVWARRSRREELVWPKQEIDRMTKILRKLGVEDSSIIRTPLDEMSGFEKLVVQRHGKKNASMNHAISWALVVVHATLLMREFESIKQNSGAAGTG